MEDTFIVAPLLVLVTVAGVVIVLVVVGIGIARWVIKRFND